MNTPIAPFRIGCSSFGRRGLWWAGIGAASALSLCGFAADAGADEDAEAETEYRNWIETVVGGSILDGNQGSFQQRTQYPRGAFGGVQSFHYEQDVGKGGLFKVDGRGIYDNEDYDISFELSKSKKGFVRGGYREYRNYYDGSGGYFPATGSWFSPYNDALSVERRRAWIEFGLTLPDLPSLTIKYTLDERDGQKDSLVWGDAALAGLPGNNLRSIVPSFWDLDEISHLLEVDLAHHIGKTDLGVGIRYQAGSSDNSRGILRTPGTDTERNVRHSEDVGFDLFNAHGFTKTRLGENTLLTTGYSYTTMDTDLSGSRIYGSSYEPVYDPVFARRQFLDEGFLDLSGGSRWNQYVMNANLMFTPVAHLTVVPSLRAEHQQQESISQYMTTFVDQPPALTTLTESLAAESDRGLTDLTGSLEVRYTGVTNWVFYASGLWTGGRGDHYESQTAVATADPRLLRDTDLNRMVQKYTGGISWYPMRKLSFAAQYYHKIRENDYDHLTDSTPVGGAKLYPAYVTNHDFTTDDVNFRVTWRPWNNFTLVSRYDFQATTTETAGMGLGPQDSADITSHIFSESITWSPLPRWYLQGSINYVIDETDTPADELSAAVGAVISDMHNDYWNVSVGTGYALDDKTDIELQYFFYRADNYEGLALSSVPYGASAEEHGVLAGITRKLTQRLRVGLKYGYFNNRDETSGGNNNYTAHLVYSNLLFQF